jgi:hypothetical protein
LRSVGLHDTIGHMSQEQWLEMRLAFGKSLSSVDNDNLQKWAGMLGHGKMMLQDHPPEGRHVLSQLSETLDAGAVKLGAHPAAQLFRSLSRATRAYRDAFGDEVAGFNAICEDTDRVIVARRNGASPARAGCAGAIVIWAGASVALGTAARWLMS